MVVLHTFFDFEILRIRDTGFTVEFFVIQLIFPFILVLVLSNFMKRITKLILEGDAFREKKNQHSDTKNNTQKTTVLQYNRYNSVVRIIRTLEKIAMVIIIFRVLLLLLSLRKITGILTTPFFTTGNTNISFLTIVQIIILFYIASIASKLSTKIVHRYVIRHIAIKNKNLLNMLIRYSILIVVIFIGLPFIGIDIGSLNLVFGALGFGIGFGLQDIVGNFIAGISINTFQLVNEGDRVIVMDIEGIVEQINMLHTVIRNLSGDELIIPNKYITNNALQNFTHSDRFFYIHCAVQVSYQSDLYLVERVMREAGESMLNRAKEKEMYFRVKEFAESGINVALYVCIEDVGDRYAVSSDLHLKIWDLFRKYDINIPYPKMDIRVQQNRERRVRSGISQTKEKHTNMKIATATVDTVATKTKASRVVSRTKKKA